MSLCRGTDSTTDQRKTGLLDQALALFDVGGGPDLAGRHVIECGDNAGGTGLSDLFERDRVIGPEPAPGFFHCIESSTLRIAAVHARQLTKSAILMRYAHRFSRTLALFLPGIFLLGFNIGTGSVTAMAKAGATYGMSLLWTIVASCLATYFMINVYGRLTLVTGETALQAFRRHIHPLVGLFFIVALTAGVSGSVMGVMGIVAEISSEWSKALVDGGIAPVWFAAFFVALVYFIFWNGKTQFFERSLAVIVAIMAACFILNFFILMPPPVDIAERPGAVASGGSAGRRQRSVSRHRIDGGHDGILGPVHYPHDIGKRSRLDDCGRRKQRNDAIVAVVMMFVISGSIMAAAAGTLYVEGLGLEKASQMIGLLEPLAGSFATTIFVVGIVAAGVSSQFPERPDVALAVVRLQSVGAGHDFAAVSHHRPCHFIARAGSADLRGATHHRHDRLPGLQCRHPARDGCLYSVPWQSTGSHGRASKHDSHKHRAHRDPAVFVRHHVNGHPRCLANHRVLTQIWFPRLVIFDCDGVLVDSEDVRQ